MIKSRYEKQVSMYTLRRGTGMAAQVVALLSKELLVLVAHRQPHRLTCNLLWCK